MSKPVLVTINLTSSSHSNRFISIWGDTKKTILELHPNIRFFDIMVGNDRKFNHNIVPSYLTNYTRWFPMILFVPGTLWNEAIRHLGIDNPIEIKEDVQIMNGYWDDNDDLKFILEHNYTKKEEILSWVDKVYGK